MKHAKDPSNSEEKKLLFSMVYPSFFIGVLWIIYFIEKNTHTDWSNWGIYPLQLYGLKGILFSPFLHADAAHLLANSIPLWILGSLLFYFFPKKAFSIVGLSWIFGGIWIWIAARPAYHIGASGIVYSLTTFLFFIGIFKRHRNLMAVGLLVIFLYGSLVWGMFPHFFPKEDISWEGHLFGALAGIVLAFYFRKEGPALPVYYWDENDDAEQLQDDPPDSTNPNDKP